MTEPTTLQPLPEDWSRGLAIVAHPDDLEYGSASAIARWTAQGKEIIYLLITRGEAGIDSMDPAQSAEVRSQEERNSAAAVGVHTVEFLDHHDGVIEYGLPLRRDIARAIRTHKPEIIISINYQRTWPGGWQNMADHVHAGMAILDGRRDAANRWVFRELLEEGLEPWGGVKMVCFNASPNVTHAVEVTDTFDKGVASLREHKAYLKAIGQTDPDGMLRGVAESIGQQFGCPLAVSFEVIG